MFQQQMGSEVTIISDGNNLGLPLKSAGDVTAFNTQLEDANEFAKTCGFLQTIGGKDVQDTTISCIISNNLALNYNCAGQNNKTPFSNLKNVLKLLTGKVKL